MVFLSNAYILHHGYTQTFLRFAQMRCHTMHSTPQKNHDCAEEQAMLEFHNIVNSGRFQLLPHTGPHYGCRVSGPNAPVIHDSSYINEECPPYVKIT